jgi:hypothetical protein
MWCPELTFIVLAKKTKKPVLDKNGKPEWDWSPKHGLWGFQIDVAASPGSGKERPRIRRGGFETIKEVKYERG